MTVTPKKAIQVTTDGKDAWVRYVETDGAFTYIVPIEKGSLENMRKLAEEIRQQHILLEYNEIDLRISVRRLERA